MEVVSVKRHWMARCPCGADIRYDKSDVRKVASKAPAFMNIPPMKVDVIRCNECGNVFPVYFKNPVE